MSIKVYEENGLPFWSAQDIQTRNYITAFLSLEVKDILLQENRGWIFKQIEAPSLIPSELISKEYNNKPDNEDYFQVLTPLDIILDEQNPQFSLRPETTASSYEYMRQLFDNQQKNPPLCIWQLAKSFRNENDQVSKNMRFKEFYQLEFQCVYTAETKNDYHKAVLEPLRAAVQTLVGNREVRLVKSDRLPSYSESTMDIEVDTGYKMLEVCSISLRNDVPFKWNGKELRNVEIAFGADRLTEVLGDG